MFEKAELTRRSMIRQLSVGAMGTAALSLQAPATVAATSSSIRVPFDPTDVGASTMAFLKLTGSQGNELVRRWFTGKIYAYFPGEKVKELFYMDGFYYTNFWRQDDGTHRSTTYEITFLRDIETGKLLEKWNNPFTGEVNDIIDTVGGPQERLYNRWGWDNPKKPRMEENPRVLDWTLVDDTAWLTWDSLLRFPNPLQPEQYPEASSGKDMNLVNLTNYYGKLSDLENPEIINAPGTMFWSAITDWLPWMHMGQRPGMLFHKAIGVKINSYRDVPKEVFDAGEARFPGCLTEKVQWPEGGYAWNDYIKFRTEPE